MEGTVIQCYDWRERRGECRGDYLPQVTLEICKYLLKLNQCITKLPSTLKWYLCGSLLHPAGLSKLIHKLDSRYKADCDRKGGRTFTLKKRVIGSPSKLPRATGPDWALTQVAEADWKPLVQLQRIRQWNRLVASALNSYWHLYQSCCKLTSLSLCLLSPCPVNSINPNEWSVVGSLYSREPSLSSSS